MQLFEYVIFYEPNAQETKKGAAASILRRSDLFIANDLKEATIRAYRDIPEDYLASEKIKDVRVTLRPF